MFTFDIVLGLFGGLALFVFALQSMSSGLQKMAGKKARRVMEALTSIPIVGVLVGTFVTIVLQSSTLVTVMVVGFVNASMLNLKQAISVIMGANIGTTLTAQLVAFRVTDYWPVLAAVGFIVYFVFKQKKIKTTGHVVFSLGLLLLGMALMGDAMRPLRGDPTFESLMVTLSTTPLLGFLVGVLFTALVQSSTAATGVIIAMSTGGLIPLDAALPLILGTNVGTCITALFASIGTTVSAKRAAMAHVTFNVFGAVLFLVLLPQFRDLVLVVSPADDIPRQIANSHTLFSVINTLIFLPLITPFTKLVTLMVPGKETEGAKGPIYLDWNPVVMEKSPGVAISLAQKELLRMAEVAGHNVQLAMEGFLERDSKKLAHMHEQEELVDDLDKEISRYLAKVSQSDMGDELSLRHTGLLYAANDIERVSDHADNLAELAQYAIDENIVFNDIAIEELKELYTLVRAAYDTAIESLRTDDPALAATVSVLEDEIDAKEGALRSSHIGRLKEGRCSADNGVIYLDMISNFERIGDHSLNLADVPLGNL